MPSHEYHDLIYEEDEDFLTPSQIKRRNAERQGYKGHHTNPLLRWAEEKRGKKFTNPVKQKRAISSMLYAGYEPDDIKVKWQEMEQDEYWTQRGFDFMNVQDQINKDIKKTKVETSSPPEAPDTDRQKADEHLTHIREDLKRRGIFR